jgi:uncharacterized repeat protein (TIGR02543 family)
MTIKLKVGSDWKNIASFKLKTGSVWKNISKAYIKTGSVWKIFFGKAGPQIDFPLEISAAGSVHPETLTGTNYHWDSGNVFTYIFQKANTNSLENIDWSDIDTYQTITNPSDGTSNTKTYITLDADFDVSKKSKWFRFSVKAVNTVSSEQTIEYSNGIEIKIKPKNKTAPIVTPASGIAGTDTFTTTNGTWDYAPTTYIYLWRYRESATIYPAAPGVNNQSTYSPPADFVTLYGADLKCTVVASNGISSDPVDSNTVTVTAGTRTVNWNANGGSVSPTSGTGSAPNYTVIAPTPTRTGFTFNGWYNTSQGTYEYGPIAGGGSFNIPSGVTTMFARWTAILAPVNTVTPTVTPSSGIAGTTTYSSTTGSWNNSPTSYSYQWRYYDGGIGAYQNIAGATSSTYSPPSNFFSSYSSPILCRVTASNAGGSNFADSNSATVSQSTITVTWNANGGSGGGSTTQNTGAAHTAPSPGTRSGFTFNGYYNTLQGTYDYGPIASGGSFTPPSNITMYARWTAVSPPVNTAAPIVTPSSGTAGTTTYSVTNGSWNNSPTSFSYQWRYRDSGSTYLNISGATSSTYSPPSNYVSVYGSTLRCVVTASNDGGSASATSNDVTVNSPVSTPTGGSVSISTNTGNYNVGSIITYSTSGWTGSPTSYNLRLYNGTNPVLTSDPLRASTTSSSGTYTIATADVGKFFKAFATATNSAGTSTEASSTQVGPAVSPPAVPAGGSATLSGSGVAGTVITASTSGWSGSPTTYSLRILAGVDGVSYPITKATNSPTSSSTVSYTVTSSDAAAPAYIFIARATATNGVGTSLQAESGTITSSPAAGPFFPPFFPFFPFFPTFATPFFPSFATPFFPSFATPFFPSFGGNIPCGSSGCGTYGDSCGPGSNLCYD